MDHLTRDGVRFRLTMTLSPPLLAMMEDPLLMRRCERRIESLLKLASRDGKRAALHQPEFFEATLFAEQDLASLRELFVTTHNRDLIGAFARHRAAGSLEIITCGATHGAIASGKSVQELVEEEQEQMGNADGDLQSMRFRKVRR